MWERGSVWKFDNETIDRWGCRNRRAIAAVSIRLLLWDVISDHGLATRRTARTARTAAARARFQHIWCWWHPIPLYLPQTQIASYKMLTYQINIKMTSSSNGKDSDNYKNRSLRPFMFYRSIMGLLASSLSWLGALKLLKCVEAGRGGIKLVAADRSSWTIWTVSPIWSAYYLMRCVISFFTILRACQLIPFKRYIEIKCIILYVFMF